MLKLIGYWCFKIMLTPFFSVSQTDCEVIIVIHAPYAHLSETEIYATSTDFFFYSSPYFLRLHFKNDLKEDDSPRTEFDADKGEFTVQLCKGIPGTHFPDLDLLGTLLTPKNKRHQLKPEIQVVKEEGIKDESGSGAVSDDVVEDDGESDSDEWFFEQTLVENKIIPGIDSPKYGFANQTQGVFRQVKREFSEIIDLRDPDDTPADEREALRTESETDAFSSDHYLADYMQEEEVIQPYLDYIPPWHLMTYQQVKLTREEQESLKKLGNKEFLLSKEDFICAWLSLVDIIYGFCYNHRSTQGDNTVESAWTINKLSATLSWLQVFPNLESVVKSCFRRSLCYPLFRNWKLSCKVLEDTIKMLSLGRRQVLKCLLKIHELFDSSEPRYLLNQLYITDYCIWIQSASDNKLRKLTSALQKMYISKEDVGFDLNELEIAAHLVEQEEKEQQLIENVANIKLNESEALTSGSEGSEDSESESSDEDSSSLDSDDFSSTEEM